MEPLRLELDEATSLKLQASSQSIKDDVEGAHTRLLRQVRAFYAQKQQELVQYAQSRLNAPQSPPSPSVSNTPPKNIKSIVKRRPSSAEKRVSFSRSPPHVELFKKLEDLPYDDEDDEDDEKSMPEQADSKRNSKPRSRQPEEPFKPSSPYLVFTRSSPAPSRHDNDNSDVDNHHQDSLFSFEDIIDSVPGSTSNERRDSVQSQSSEHAIGSDQASDEDFLYVENNPTSPNAVPRPTNEDDFVPFVGSAPMDIKASQWGLECDGGPPPRTAAELKDEQAENLSLSVSRIDLPASLDPSNMSFSQRMEWEQMHKLRREVA